MACVPFCTGGSPSIDGDDHVAFSVGRPLHLPLPAVRLVEEDEVPQVGRGGEGEPPARFGLSLRQQALPVEVNLEAVLVAVHRVLHEPHLAVGGVELDEVPQVLGGDELVDGLAHAGGLRGGGGAFALAGAAGGQCADGDGCGQEGAEDCRFHSRGCEGVGMVLQVLR